MGSSVSVQRPETREIPNAEFIHSSLSEIPYVTLTKTPSSTSQYDQWWVDNDMDVFVEAVSNDDKSSIRSYHLVELLRCMDVLRKKMQKTSFPNSEYMTMYIKLSEEVNRIRNE